MQNYSQTDEVQVIIKLLTLVCGKVDYNELTYVDVGAYDGMRNSNSYNFAMKGSKVFMIEPNKLTFARLAQNVLKLKNVVCENVACSDYNGSTRLYFGTDKKDSMLSTTCRDKNSWFDYSRSNKYQVVKVCKLDSLLNRYNVPHNFDILSIDTEGNDFEVLKGMTKYKPKIIITEEYRHNVSKHKAKYKLLSKRGYLLVSEVGCNTIWIDRTNSKNAISLVDIRNELVTKLKENASKIGVEFIDFEKVKKIIQSDNNKISLIKSPKWIDDALIFQIKGTNLYHYNWTVKLHEDKYPLASHVYNSEDVMYRVSNSSFASKIHMTTVSEGSGKPLRIVIYDYIVGVPLSKYLQDADEQTVASCNEMLKKCIRNLIINSRVNPLVRDLGDFLLTTDASGNRKVVLTDYNNLMECSKSGLYARQNIFEIIDPVIDSLVKSDCNLFEKERPRLTDAQK